MYHSHRKSTEVLALEAEISRLKQESATLHLRIANQATTIESLRKPLEKMDSIFDRSPKFTPTGWPKVVATGAGTTWRSGQPTL